MNRKKTIAVALVLALILIIGGMLAYFTDTDRKTNVFTLGDEVNISLTEANWDTTDSNSNNVPDAAEGLHPNTIVDKDPVINNESTTTPAYVFAEVIVPCYDSEDADTLADKPLYKLLDSNGDALGTTVGSDGNSGWTLISVSSVDTTNKTITYVYAYGTSSTMTSLAKKPQSGTSSTPAVFSQVQVEPTLTYAQSQTASATPNIVVNAYGIQTDGLDVTTPTAIYALFGNS